MSGALNPNPSEGLSGLLERSWRNLVWDVVPTNLLPHLKIDITASDIESGRPCNAERCAISLAISRTLFALGIRYVAISVTERDIEINLNWRSAPVRYSHDAADLVRDFDNLEPVLPRTIELRRIS